MLQHQQIEQIKIHITILLQQLQTSSPSPSPSSSKIISIYHELGKLYFDIYDSEKSLIYYSKGIELSLSTNEKEMMIKLYMGKGDVKKYQNDYKNCLMNYMKGLEICKKNGEKSVDEWMIMSKIGIVNYRVGKVEKGKKYFEKSLNGLKEVEKQKMMMMNKEEKLSLLSKKNYVMNYLGDVYRSIGKLEKALELYMESLEISKVTKITRDQRVILNRIGRVYYDIGNPRFAMVYLNKSIEIGETINDKSGDCETYGIIGKIHGSILGELKMAEKVHLKALEISRTMKNKECEGKSLFNLAELNYISGKYNDCLILYNASLQCKLVTRDKRGEGEVLIEISRVYFTIGDIIKSYENVKKALEIAEKTSNIHGQAMTLHILGKISNEKGKIKNALELYQKAYKIYSDGGVFDKRNEGILLCDIGRVYHKNSIFVDALKYYKLSKTLCAQAYYQKGVAVVLNLQGEVYGKIGVPTEGMQYFKEALDVARKVLDRVTEGRILRNVGEVYLLGGKYHEAQEMFNAAMKIFLHILSGMSGETSQSMAYSESTENFKKCLQSNIHIYIIKNKWLETLKLIEMSKSLSFVRIFQKSLQHSKFSQISNIQYQFPKDKYCLHYYLFSEKDLIRMLFLNGANIKIDRVVIDSKEVKEMLNDFEDKQADVMVTCKKLYSILIEGFENFIPKNNHFIIFPHSYLFLVPFNCLVDKSGKFFIEEHIFSISSSLLFEEINEKRLNAIKHYRKNIVNKIGGLFVVDPVNNKELGLDDLNNAKEATIIANRIKETSSQDSIILKNKDLSLNGFKEELKKHLPEFLYFGTHCSSELQEKFDEYNVSGGIVLSNNELLYANEVTKLSSLLNGIEFVFMNCCATSKGRILNQGILGLNFSFFQSGIPTVISTLSNVDNECSRIIGKKFFEFYSTGKYSKTYCLRGSMIYLMNLSSKTLSSSSKEYPFLYSLIKTTENQGKTLKHYPQFWGVYELFGHDK